MGNNKFSTLKKLLLLVFVLMCTLSICFACGNSKPDTGDSDTTSSDSAESDFTESGSTADAAEALIFNLKSDGTYSVSMKANGVACPENFVIPDTYNGAPVTTILSFGFAYARDIFTLTIPEHITEIGENAFIGCCNLKTIYWNSIDVGDIISFYTENKIFVGCSNITEVKFGDKVKDIPALIFCDCKELKSITIGGSVTTIGDGAFFGCSGLTNITIPDSVTSIGNYAFSGCSGLTDVAIPDGITTIGESAFRGCSGLTSVVIGNGVTSIGSEAFKGCSGLTNITIPDSVISIGELAFDHCNGLTSVEFKNKKGWKIYLDNRCVAELSADDLKNFETAATYLTIKYNRYEEYNGFDGYTWMREDKGE